MPSPEEILAGLIQQPEDPVVSRLASLAKPEPVAEADPVVSRLSQLTPPADPLIARLQALSGEGGAASEGEGRGGVGNGAIGGILHVLGYLSRPSKAIWTGIDYGMSPDPEKTALSGAWAGLTGKSDTELGNVVGLPQATPEDPWAPWLAKHAANFLVNAAGDPVSYIGLGPVAKVISKGIGGLGRAVGYSEKVAGAAEALKAAESPLAQKLGYAVGNLEDTQKLKEALAGTLPARWFMHTSPSEDFNAIVQGAKTQGNIELEPLYAAAQQALETLAKHPGIDDKMVFEALERPAGEAAKQVPQEVIDAFQPLLKAKEGQIKTFNDLAEPLGMQTMGEVKDPYGMYQYVSRVVDKQKEVAEKKWLRINGGGGVPEGPTSRELVRWVDPAEAQAGRLVDPAGDVVISKLEHGSMDRNGIRSLAGDQYLMKVGEEWKPVVPVQASRLDLEKAGIDKFLSKADMALVQKGEATQNRINFMRMMKGITEAVDDKMEPAFAQLWDKAKPVPSGWAYSKIPGFEDHIFKKFVRNQLENAYNLMYDPDSAVDVLTAAMRAFGKTGLGETLNSLNQTWKRGQLAVWPGFHTGNLVSNKTLEYLAGAHDPRLQVWGTNVSRGWNLDAASGVAGKTVGELRDMLNKAGTFGHGMQEAGESSIANPNRYRFTEALNQSAQNLGVPESIASAPAKVANLAERANERGFKIGQAIEDQSKAVVAIDWLRKWQKAGNEIDQAAVNQAKMVADKYLFDYTLRTPLEQQLRQIVPFYSWARNILGLTLKSAGSLQGLSKLDQIGRIQDFLFQPLSKMDARMTPGFITGGSSGAWPIDMVRSALGYPNQGNEVFETGRYNAFGSIQQMADNPKDYILGQLGPVPKAMAELPTGYSFFRHGPIDRIAGNAVSGAINPIIGGPYEKAYQKMLGVTLPATWDYALRSYTPVSRLLSTANQMGANTLWEDRGIKEQSLGGKGMWLMTGGKATDIDRPRWTANKKRSFDDELSQIRGALKTRARLGDSDGVNYYAGLLREASVSRNPFIDH